MLFTCCLLYTIQQTYTLLYYHIKNQILEHKTLRGKLLFKSSRGGQALFFTSLGGVEHYFWLDKGGVRHFFRMSSHPPQCVNHISAAWPLIWFNSLKYMLRLKLLPNGSYPFQHTDLVEHFSLLGVTNKFKPYLIIDWLLWFAILFNSITYIDCPCIWSFCLGKPSKK